MPLSTFHCGHAQGVVRLHIIFMKPFAVPQGSKKKFFLKCLALYDEVYPLDLIPRADKQNAKSVMAQIHGVTGLFSVE